MTTPTTALKLASVTSPIEAMHSQWLSAQAALERIDMAEGGGERSSALRQLGELVDSLASAIMLSVPMSERDAAILAFHAANAADVIAACETTSSEERDALATALSVLTVFMMEQSGGEGRSPVEGGAWLDSCRRRRGGLLGEIAAA